MMTYTEQDKIDIIEAYNAGQKLTEVGKRYGVSGDTISYYIMKWGVPKRDNRKYKFTEDDYKFLEKEYPIGNWNAIFERFPNVPRNKIYRIMSDRKISQDSYHWTEHDKDILIQYYGWLNVQDIQSMLENTYSVRLIQNQAKKMGLTESREWTDEEIQILYDNYECMTGEEIQVLLPHKSVNAIYLKASSLGLQSGWKHKYLFTQEEDEFILNNWENMSDREMSWSLNRSIESIKMRRQRMGLLHEFGKSSYATLIHYIRMNIYEWKKRAMQECDYKCALTGRQFDEIHHIHSFHLILKETLRQTNIDDRKCIDKYTNEELEYILNTFKKIQNTYPSGVCLCVEVHRLFHNIYGRGGTTEEHWNKFVEDFKQGKYVDIIHN